VPKNPSERNPGRAHHGEIWQVARATSAAPTYFTPITINNRKFGDGGFGTNNPAWEVIWEVTQMTGKTSDLGNIALMVSIGTGMSPLSKFGQGLLGKYYAYFRAAKKLAVDSENVHDRMMTVTGGKDGKVPYYRFNVRDGLGEMKLDEWKAPKKWRRRKENLTLKCIREKTDDYLQLREVQDDLEKLAKILVENRRKRCKTAIWDMVCLGMQYRCCFEGCPKTHKMRRSARDLCTHLRISHELDETKAKDKEIIEKLIETGRCPC
jgi:predicted acylesterase/phospholipase RssA